MSDKVLDILPFSKLFTLTSALSLSNQIVCGTPFKYSQVKEYIKNTITDTQTKSYKYKKFFVPIIILNDSVYYFEYKTGIFLTKYGQTLDEGLKILGIK